MMKLTEQARRRGNHRAAQAVNARIMNAMAKKKAPTVTADDQLAIPDFLKRTKDPKSKAEHEAAWEKFLAANTRGKTAQEVKRTNWLKPRSLTDEEFEAFTAQMEEKKKVKQEVIKAKKAARVNTVGKRWDAINNRWVDEKTRTTAMTATEEEKMVRAATKAANKERKEAAKAERKAKTAVPLTGILAEFNCKPGTFRATLLLTLEAAGNKMVPAETLAAAVYGDKTKTSPLQMVIKGAAQTIEQRKLPYKLQGDNKVMAWGLYNPNFK